MIENCPNCEKTPKFHDGQCFWGCYCLDTASGPFISGPNGDESGEGWNAMVRRMRENCGAPAKPASYPNCMAILERELASKDAAIRSWESREDGHVKTSRERDEWKSRAEKAETDLSIAQSAFHDALSATKSERDEWRSHTEQWHKDYDRMLKRAGNAEAELAKLRSEIHNDAILRDAIGEAWNKFQEAAQKLVTPKPVALNEPRQNWFDLSGSPAGTQLVSDELAANYPGVYVEKNAYGGWRISEHSWDRVSPETHHNWRVLSPEPALMTWAELNATAKVGDRATCGRFKDGWYIRREMADSQMPFAWRMEPKEKRRDTISGVWMDQTDWRIIGHADE